MSSTHDTLMAMYRAMRERLGHQDWWPGDTPLEVCVGAILTQNTNWQNVEKAIANLKSAEALSVEALHAMPADRLAELIRPAGYYNIKARRLKNFIARAHAWPDGLEGFLALPASRLREELLAVNGIGRETADSMILYAAGQTTFVVDTYTFRVLLRHGLIERDFDYEMIKDLLESNLPSDLDLFNDFHAQFVAVGKQFCRPTARCAGCPLELMPHDPRAGMEEF